MNEDKRWIEWVRELQFLAQCGLAYSKNEFDIERFKRIREIAAEMAGAGSGMPLRQVKNLFCGETGYQTPKLDTRAAVFENGKILLVREKKGTWSLPGGWVDVDQSVGSNTVKEVKEEAGLDVRAVRLIAVQDRRKHNIPEYIHGVCKVFVLCEALGGEFQENMETTESRFFPLSEIPELAAEKNSMEQIRMCFEAAADPQWQVQFD
ncbi:NUDIX hydrolase [Ruminococcus sp. OA3]|uniref:NUDIX hydrolase N-terminal domain-containing protein n=1 Tax=Ruminococcus sp. OA3 TaxID=2914164 RepID=UPI001F058223|nr:NUDIX hydrolase [Ruminococcus sp. OA3]MCH1984338.1 NUDIX hydrolase [Ruminococcus sp. OA3]